jgi:DNA repair exonuclease SbcCD nuclease subunit
MAYRIAKGYTEGMKFLHTADWQIGMKAAHVGRLGQLVRDRRLQTAGRVVQAAKENAAEFILVAGDTFEDNAVDRVLVRQTADVLASFGGPVYILPGNHDPLVPGSVWHHPAWQSHPQLRVLTSPTLVELPAGRLIPCPVFEKHSTADPTAWIQPEETPGIRIGLAHGSVREISRDNSDHPIDADAASRCALDYLALGHWHSTLTFDDGDGATRMAYSGTHETTKFGERDSGNVLLVEIGGPGQPPKIAPIKTGFLTWEIQEESLRSPGDMTRVRQTLEGRRDCENTLLELRLSGILQPADQIEIQRIEELLSARFFHGRIDRSGMSLQPADDLWWQSLPSGPVREAAKRLRALCEPAPEESQPESATAEIAARALLELYAIVEEGS